MIQMVCATVALDGHLCMIPEIKKNGSCNSTDVDISYCLCEMELG